jgi:hypothetical protein
LNILCGLGEDSANCAHNSNKLVDACMHWEAQELRLGAVDQIDRNKMIVTVDERRTGEGRLYSLVRGCLFQISIADASSEGRQSEKCSTGRFGSAFQEVNWQLGFNVVLKG